MLSKYEIIIKELVHDCLGNIQTKDNGKDLCIRKKYYLNELEYNDEDNTFKAIGNLINIIKTENQQISETESQSKTETIRARNEIIDHKNNNYKSLRACVKETGVEYKLIKAMCDGYIKGFVLNKNMEEYAFQYVKGENSPEINKSNHILGDSFETEFLRLCRINDENSITKTPLEIKNNDDPITIEDHRELTNSKNDTWKCKETDQTNCNWRCNFRQTERSKKYYQEKVRHDKVKCERCGLMLIKSRLLKHQNTDKCKSFAGG